MGLVDELGLRPLMVFSHNYDEALVCQFLATVHFANETERYVTWMTKTEKLTMTWDKVGGLLGYEEHGPSCALPLILMMSGFAFITP